MLKLYQAKKKGLVPREEDQGKKERLESGRRKSREGS